MHHRGQPYRATPLPAPPSGACMMIAIAEEREVFVWSDFQRAVKPTAQVADRQKRDGPLKNVRTIIFTSAHLPMGVLYVHSL